MTFGKIGIGLFLMFLTISFLTVSAGSIRDSITVKDSVQVHKFVELKSISDTIKSEFVNDTIDITKPVPIGQIIYTEHKTNLNILLDYAFPIIMLMLGVIIDRLVLMCSEHKRIEREGMRWKSELDSLIAPIHLQQKAFKKFITEYCNVKDRFDIPSLNLQVLLKCKIFDSLNKEELYKYLRSKCKNDEIATKEYHKSIQAISSIKSCQQSLSSVVSEMRSESNKLISQFNKCTQEYNRKLIACLNANQLPVEGSVLQTMYTTLNQQMPYINILKLEESFVRPSIEILEKSKSDSPYRLELLFSLFSMLDIIMGLRNEKIYIKQNLTQLTEVYSKVAGTIASLKFD